MTEQQRTAIRIQQFRDDLAMELRAMWETGLISKAKYFSVLPGITCGNHDDLENMKVCHAADLVLTY